MPRRYYRRRTVNKDKYSIENSTFRAPVSWVTVPQTSEVAASLQTSISVIPPIGTQGMRKVKHLTLSFSCESETEPVWYALVYVPEGYDPNSIQIPPIGYAISLYEPNQYVMSSGVLDFNGGPLRIKTPLSRNLNSGDSIYLVMAIPKGDSSQVIPKIVFNVQYAITLQ